MDGSSFDHLSRRLVGLSSRRLALKTIAVALVASVTGERTAHAQSCTAQYRPCQSDGQCCAGSVCQSGMCQPGCRIDGAFRSASTPQPGNTCARCDPSRSTTTWSPINEGMACWSGGTNLCGGPSTCQNGSCTGTSSITCQPLTACHVAGECNPNTGLCTHPPAPAGLPCGGTETCLGGLHTPGMTCDGNGFCTAGSTRPCAPYACGTGSCLTSCSSTAHCTPGAVCIDAQCVVPAGNGAPCADGRFCQSGFCRDNVCCNEACTSACSTCATGACRPKNCNDNLACTADSCDPTTGDCVHTRNPIACLIAGACYATGAQNPADRCQMCDPATNSWVAVVCDDALPCTTDACNPATGTCTYTLNAGFCALGGACYDHGAPNPANQCQLCDAASNSWIDRVCASGSCVDGVCVCPPFTTLSGDTCVHPCTLPGACPDCGSTPTGDTVCLGPGSNWSCITPICSSDADCPSGHTCLHLPGSTCSHGSPVCVQVF